MKERKEIIELHNQIISVRAAYPLSKKRDEHLKGWERALRWILNQEEAPMEASKHG